MDIETVMDICSEALEKAGYTVSEYSETYQRITVTDGGYSISVDFDEK